MTFREWCRELATVHEIDGELSPGLMVDGQPFRLDDRPAMEWVYDQIPSTPEEAFRGVLVLRKCAQVGFTVLEILATIYLGLKFGLKVGLFLPSRQLAVGKSAERFMPIVRTIPQAHRLLTVPAPRREKSGKGEGNVLTRRMGDSLFHFLWTSGKTATESFPMDVVSFDEVQEMLISDMEKAMECLSASKFKFVIMGSTANWPDADIDYWYKKGSQYRFHTRCPTCGVEEPLDDYFPACIKFDPDHIDAVSGVPGDYRYVCKDGHWIDDSQVGEWKPDNPEADLRKIKSIHFHQMLSPTISPREMIEAYMGASDMKNYYNRKLGKPYQDPSQVPVTLAHLNACAEEGQRIGLTWKKRSRNSFMGIDQMGAFNVAIIKERLADGRQAVIHVEEIYSDDPFQRCSELMEEFGVAVCVVEQLPNFNDAMRFANRHKGRVFLCNGYGPLEGDVMVWGDAPRLNVSERRTDDDERTRYTVRIDQYKAMSMTLARLVNTQCLFPNPQDLVQDIREKEARQLKPILKDVVFLHYQKTALVTERINEGERKVRRTVVKVGIDPHFSFATMLCDVAYSRAHGTATFLIPDQSGTPSTPVEPVDILPPAIVAELAVPEGTCARCVHYPIADSGPPKSAYCAVIEMRTAAKNTACAVYAGQAGDVA